MKQKEYFQTFSRQT